MLFGNGLGDGAGWYRVIQPARWLADHGVEVEIVTDKVALRTEDLGSLTTFVTQRGLHPSLVMALGVMRSKGIRGVYELDDDIWSVPPYNPLRDFFTKDRLRQMEGVIRSCDAVTVSTERLARMVWPHNRETFVVPNAIPLDLVPPAGPRTKPGVRVGWFGSATHAGDLECVGAALRKALNAYPEVRVVFVNQAPPGLEGHPRVEVHGWIPIERYYEGLRALELDIVIAPLTEHRFNFAKSNVKAIEAGALGLPILASDVGPYQEIRNGETGLRVKGNRPDLWQSLLGELIRDERLRARLGAGGRAWVEQHYTMAQTGPLWAKALGVGLRGGSE